MGEALGRHGECLRSKQHNKATLCVFGSEIEEDADWGYRDPRLGLPR